MDHICITLQIYKTTVYVYTRDTKDAAWILREGPITTTEPDVVSLGRQLAIDDTGKVGTGWVLEP